MDKTLEYTQDNTINKLKLLFLLDKMEIPLTENNIIDIGEDISYISTVASYIYENKANKLIFEYYSTQKYPSI